MSSKETPIPIAVHSFSQDVYGSIHNRISDRAYQLYEQSGGNQGEDIRHWLQAESEILSRVPDVRESGSWFTVNIPIPGSAPSDLHISLEPTHAIIAVENFQKSADVQTSGANSNQLGAFKLVKWPGEVDPATASAYFQNHILNLTVKRA